MIDACDRPGGASPCAAAAPAALQEGWVIANHILVSFHVAFISSVLALPPISLFKWHVLRFVFASPETLVSAVFAYLSFPRRQEPAARDPRADHPAQPLSQQSATASPAAPLPPHYAKPVDPGRQAEPHRPPWTDTIDLAERYIPGSDIVNELRRTSHHALGKRPLLIAQAYHATSPAAPPRASSVWGSARPPGPTWRRAPAAGSSRSSSAWWTISSGCWGQPRSSPGSRSGRRLTSTP